jgi:RNA polymerase-binding transcription factor DksA
MRQHFHRCTNLRVVSVEAGELSGDRHGGSVILDELCDARKLARCVGLVDCDVLTPAQKRELLGTRVTRMREEEGGATALGELGGERGRAIVELARELREEREEIVAENRRLLAEATAAEDRRERTAARSDELAFAESGISLRWDEHLQRLRASRLDSIDRALEDMAGSNYGLCARCRGLIATERLREAPDTRVCSECAGRSAPVG